MLVGPHARRVKTRAEQQGNQMPQRGGGSAQLAGGNEGEGKTRGKLASEQAYERERRSKSTNACVRTAKASTTHSSYSVR